MLTIIQDYALPALHSLPNESVQTCVTSPPYWGLRDYGYEGQIGLEKTPEEYMARLVEVFSEVKRILRVDGTLWLNLGDTYAGGGNGGGGTFAKDGIRAPRPGTDKNVPARTGSRGVTVKSKRIPRGAGRWGGGNNRVATLKPKDLVGIPWMIAFALRTAGWYLRLDIIWSKTNPMPESVADRPTRSHEYIFLLSKSERYYYDAEAIKEPAQLWTGQAATFERTGAVSNLVLPGQSAAQHRTVRTVKQEGKNSRINISRDPMHEREFNGKNRGQGDQWGGRRMLLNVRQAREETGSHDAPFGAMRNKRSVWTVATKPFPDAHFATFPPDLIVPCILAGAPVGGVVIDPFAGSGTTGKVAIELGRQAILIEPKAEYVEMIKRRCAVTPGLPLG